MRRSIAKCPDPVVELADLEPGEVKITAIDYQRGEDAVTLDLPPVAVLDEEWFT